MGEIGAGVRKGTDWRWEGTSKEGSGRGGIVQSSNLKNSKKCICILHCVVHYYWLARSIWLVQCRYIRSISIVSSQSTRNFKFSSPFIVLGV
jgi:hypothetical protein